MATVFDAAAYILRKTGEITTMRLQKLAYYCQAWSLVWDDAPLFNERIEAWTFGPVIPNLYKRHKGMFVIKECLDGNTINLSSIQKETIDAVLSFYGKKHTQWLVDLSHSEDPWKKAREGLAPTEHSNNEITLESMKEYYTRISLK
ncbi:MAG TPA: type II toxin-antitoxin system antitoxin SocA domain-containing protein [bacterium]|nr:type II toxin-antitoxin system antitoxin SocA domain-containing protein [bacterium]